MGSERGIWIDSGYGPIKGQTILKANYVVLNFSKKKEQKITILSIYWREDAQDSDLMFVFGRIEDTMNGFWEFLTFSMYCNAV